jgi:hypothetical protein
VLANVYDGGHLYTTAGTFNAGVSFSPGVVTINSIAIVADGATINMAGSGATPGPFPVAGSGTRGGDTLTAVGMSRFAGTNMAENMYGNYVAKSVELTYSQAGIFGGNRQ